MWWRAVCIWTSWALLPMVAVLAWKGSWLWPLYLASATVAFAYHWYRETRFRTLDHVLAWFAIAANVWLALHASHWQHVLSAGIFILLAVEQYFAAHDGDELDYCQHHTLWHLWCGMGGLMLALGYGGDL